MHNNAYIIITLRKGTSDLQSKLTWLYSVPGLNLGGGDTVVLYKNLKLKSIFTSSLSYPPKYNINEEV